MPCLASLWGVGCGRGGSAGAGGGTGLSPAVLFAAAGRTQVAGGGVEGVEGVGWKVWGSRWGWQVGEWQVGGVAGGGMAGGGLEGGGVAGGVAGGGVAGRGVAVHPLLPSPPSSPLLSLTCVSCSMAPWSILSPPTGMVRTVTRAPLPGTVYCAEAPWVGALGGA